MIFAPFLGENASRSSARPTGMPRIWSATSRPFWADRRTPRSVAVVSIACLTSSCRRGLAGAATFLSDEWPLNVRVIANSPSLWPTMFSDT